MPKFSWDAILSQAVAAVLGAALTALGGYFLSVAASGWVIHKLGGVTEAEFDSQISRLKAQVSNLPSSQAHGSTSAAEILNESQLFTKAMKAQRKYFFAEKQLLVEGPFKICRFIDNKNDNIHWADSVVMPPGARPDTCRGWAFSIFGNSEFNWQLGCVNDTASDWGKQEGGAAPARPPTNNFCHW